MGASTGPQGCLIAEPLLLVTILSCQVNVGTGDPGAKGPVMPPGMSVVGGEKRMEAST